MTQRILIVDDEKSIRFALHRYFDKQGFDVDTASSPSEARLLVRANIYALAILDLHLESRLSPDGLEVAGWIRSESPSTAVIILTALGTEDAESRAKAVGVDSFLRKPMRLSSVADVAMNLIRGAAAVMTH